MCIDYGCKRQPLLESEFLQSYFLFKSEASNKVYKDFAIKNNIRIDKEFFAEYDAAYRSGGGAGGGGSGGASGVGGAAGGGAGSGMVTEGEQRRIGGYLAMFPQRKDDEEDSDVDDEEFGKEKEEEEEEGME